MEEKAGGLRRREELRENKNFQDLPETIVIFLTEEDIYGMGETVYHLDRRIEEYRFREFGDASHVLDVNGAYRGNDSLVRLMHDFSYTDAEKKSGGKYVF